MDAYLSILRRRLREIRVSLVAFQVELGGGRMGEATASRTLSEPTLEREQISPLTDAPTLMLPDQDDPANKEH